MTRVDNLLRAQVECGVRCATMTMCKPRSLGWGGATADGPKVCSLVALVDAGTAEVGRQVQREAVNISLGCACADEKWKMLVKLDRHTW